MPIAQARTFVDKLNSTTFLGCSRGTVQFAGPKTIREHMDDGTVVQKLTYNFKWREKDWNYFLRRDGKWDEVIYNGDSSVNTFEYADLNGLLFQAPTN
jgi:hypothetical protein